MNPSTGLGWRKVLGRTSDWNPFSIRKPAIQPKIGLVGPVLVGVSVVVSWWAFVGAGSAAVGLYLGMIAIVLMAWSFLLAVRIRALEPLFGGLDSMYRVHRWAGTLAVIAMLAHTQLEPDVADGILGASPGVADVARDLAGGGAVALYVLVALSLLRWFPYRWWRWTHKALGVPFVLASWHVFTAEKSYANGSSWGWWFGGFMGVGVVSYLVRVVGRDMVAPGVRHRVTEATVRGATLELAMAPVGKPIQHEAGQFAVVKVQAAGLREPHIFTIASSPEDSVLRFFIRDLGDWTSRMHAADLVGTKVIVEGPYGLFDPLGDGHRAPVWVAGGVGITPFLSALSALQTAPASERPTLFYCVRDAADAMAMASLEAAATDGRIELVVCASSEQRRFTPDTLGDRFGEDGLHGVHVAVCGPAGLVTLVESAARSLGATHVEREDFDIRQGFGPDLSREIDALIRERLGRKPIVDLDEVDSLTRLEALPQE